MRVLALDYGSARCGCAVSDPTGTIVTPIEEVERPATKRGMAALAALVREREVETGHRGPAAVARRRRERADPRDEGVRRTGSRSAWAPASPWRCTTSGSRRRWRRGWAEPQRRARIRVRRRTCSRAGSPGIRVRVQGSWRAAIDQAATANAPRGARARPAGARTAPRRARGHAAAAGARSRRLRCRAQTWGSRPRLRRRLTERSRRRSAPIPPSLSPSALLARPAPEPEPAHRVRAGRGPGRPPRGARRSGARGSRPARPRAPG